ncbi:MAG TPA: DUF1552 domain-containing protein [Polyangiaceae bacterium]|nr:DUF1552 domain-containing protein [Polyangiaceae bacterium]
MLTRRHLLRGLGVALSLPFLESLAPRAARGQASALPKRFVPVYFPNGAAIEWWDGTGAGKDWTLPPILKPLAPIQQKSLFIKNLGNYTWRTDLLTMSTPWDMLIERADIHTQMPAGAFNTPSHSRCPGAMLTCVDGDQVRRERKVDITTSPINATTVDQVIAQGLAGKSPIASMQLGLLNGSGEFDGRNSVFSQNMSWSDPDTPMGKELDVQKVFDAIVQGGAAAPDQSADASAEAARRRALEQSALDSLKASVTSLQNRLSMSDRAELDKFLTGVRELEVKVAATPAMPASQCKPVERPQMTTDANQDPIGRMGIMNDLIVMALQCDVTRVITYMLDNSRSELVYSHVPRYDFTNDKPGTGTAGNYHAAQHAPLRQNDFSSITNWQVRVAADLLQKLDQITEGERTLLDNSLIMLFSDMHHGDHAGFDIPMMLFGGAGTFKQGEYVLLPGDPASSRQSRDLYFTIMNQYFGLGVSSFGVDVRKVPNANIAEILA